MWTVMQLAPITVWVSQPKISMLCLDAVRMKDQKKKGPGM
jgi:hypothetical protein